MSVSQEDLWADLKSCDRTALLAKYGSVMAALAHGLRGAIIATPGKTLYVADFAGIEARVLLWCAGDEDALEIFRNHQDIYCDMASAIYKYPVNKKDHPKERGIGKIAVLALGYQQGASGFATTCEKGGVIIPEDVYCEECGKGSQQHRKENHPFNGDEDVMTAAKVVNAYRTKYWRVKQLWYDQEASAIAAVESRQPVQCGVVRWVYKAPFLFCELPSGRRLSYMEPRIKSQMMPWGKEKQVLSYMGVDAYTRQWKRQPVYGGLLVENQVQAIARDLMACGMLRVEASPVYDIVLTIHDEIVAEADLGAGSVHEFEQLMSAIPDWAEGCPVEAEGWCGPRYRK